jgi:predicted kinase
MNFKLWLELVSQEEYGIENHQNQTEIVVLVGPPAIGKSTYIKSKYPESDIVSRDDIVDQVSNSLGMTYDDMFQTPPKDATIGTTTDKFGTVLNAPSWMTWTPTVYSNVLQANKIINEKLEERFRNAVLSGNDVIVDMTNMTASARKNALKYVQGKQYFKRAVVFTLQESNLPELLNRMKSRSESIKANGGSKTIGEDVIIRMVKSFQQISPDEGFDKVDTVSTFK